MLKPSLNSALADCPPASLPLASGDQGISLCPCRGFWSPKKQGVFSSAWMGLAQTHHHQNLGGPIPLDQAESGQRGCELWVPTRTELRWVCTLCCPSPGQNLLCFTAQKHDAMPGGHHIGPTPELVRIGAGQKVSEPIPWCFLMNFPQPR